MKGQQVAALVIALLLICIAGLACHWLTPTGTIFTCTTFFDFAKQDKWATFCKAMDSLQTQHSQETLNQITTWLVINEYSDAPKRDWAAAMRERYPFVEFIQKEAADKGQAHSINIALNHIHGYKYWIHWEEAWFCRAPCLDRMFAIMDASRVSQLQVTQPGDTPDWLDSDAHPRILVKIPTDYYIIQTKDSTDAYLKESPYEVAGEYMRHWPLYSLRPSINRVSDYNIGQFSTDPLLWPVRFEWEYARRWYWNGNRKAVLPDGPVVRTSHVSTYA